MGWFSDILKGVALAAVTVATAGVGAAVAGAFVATAATTVGLTGYAYAAAYYATSFIVSSTLSNMVSGALGGGKQTQSVSAQVQSRMQMLRSPAADREIVYGTVLKSGALVHAVAKTIDGVDYCWLVIVLAGHQSNTITGFYFNDDSVVIDGFGTVADPTSKYYGHILVRKHYGDLSQAADAELMAFDSNWTAAHKLEGMTYIAVRLKYSQSVFPTGLPNIRCQVTGKRPFDIRTGSPVASLTGWGNPALQVYDYLVDYMGVDSGSIDVASFTSAANICDEFVTLSTGAKEYRYRSNGVIKSGTSHRDAIKSILSSCGGALTCPQGKYVLHVAAFTAPVAQLDEDILRGPIRVRASASKKNLFNAVRGQYVNPNNYWQASDFPPITNATYAADDGGEQIFVDMQLPFTTSSTMAQRLAKIALEKSRQGITIEMPCTLAALKLRVMDNVLVNISHLGWDFDYLIDDMNIPIDEWGQIDEIGGKVFKITAMTMSDNGGVDLTLQEEAAGCYEWNSGFETNYDLAPNTTLPNPFSIGICGAVNMTEEIYETTGSAGVRSKAILTWTAPESGFVIDYELEYRVQASDLSWGEWIDIYTIRGTEYEFLDIAPGVYGFRVKARNILGVVGEYNEPKVFNVYGLTAAPGDVADFSVVPMNGIAIATWDTTVDLDVKIGGYVNIKYSALTTGAEFADGFTIAKLGGDVTDTTLPLATGTYMAKFIDSTGHYSDTETTFNVTEALIAAWTTVTTSTQHATFSGAKTGCEVSGSNLIMSATYSEATYEFDATIDMTTAATRRYHGHMKVRGYNETDTFDSTEMFDSAESFDETGSVNDSDAYLMIRTTTDDPSGSPTWTAWQKFVVADFYARAAQLKTILIRASLNNNIELQELSVAIKVPT